MHIHKPSVLSTVYFFTLNNKIQLHGVLKMQLWMIGCILVGTFIVFAIIHFLGKNKRPFKRALLSMLCGAGTLAAINATGVFTGVYLPVSLLSVLISIIGGIPGVTLMLGLNLFF